MIEEIHGPKGTNLSSCTLLTFRPGVHSLAVLTHMSDQGDTVDTCCLNWELILDSAFSYACFQGSFKELSLLVALWGMRGPNRFVRHMYPHVALQRLLLLKPPEHTHEPS